MCRGRGEEGGRKRGREMEGSKGGSKGVCVCVCIGKPWHVSEYISPLVKPLCQIASWDGSGKMGAAIASNVNLRPQSFLHSDLRWGSTFSNSSRRNEAMAHVAVCHGFVMASIREKNACILLLIFTCHNIEKFKINIKRQVSLYKHVIKQIRNMNRKGRNRL